MENNGKAVLVTTQHRGVFFGYLVGQPTKAKAVLEKVRCVVHWDRDTKGFIGLAANGPTDGCRVSAPAEQSTLFDITGVFGCTPLAVERFERAPWAR